MKKIYFSLVLLCLSSAAIAGGGWPQPKGNGYLKLAQWWVIADQHFTDLGLLDPNVTNGLFNTTFYGEYGFTDRLTGIAYVPLFSRSYFNNTVSGTTGELIAPGEAINSLGDAEVYIKYGLNKNGPIYLSASLGLGLPLGNSAGGSDGSLQTGDGEFNQMLRLDASTSKSFGDVNTYVSAHIAVNNRTNGFSDEFRYGIEIGGGFFSDRIWAIARLFGTESFQNGLPTSALSLMNTSIFANNSEHLTFSPEINVLVNKSWGISANLAKPLAGKIIFANTAYSVGIFMNI